MHLLHRTDPAVTAALARELADAGCTHMVLYMQRPFPPQTLRDVSRAVAEAVL